MTGLPTGTVTLLFTDIEGSTVLTRRLGARYDELFAAHRRVVRDAIAAHGGVEVDAQGDAFFVAFERAHDAVAAAADAQRALTQRAASDDGPPVRVRMGIHTGEPSLTAKGYYVGVDLTRAARICAAAHGEQVLLSSVTRDLVLDEFETRDLGEHLLKDIDAPERLFQLLGRGLRSTFPPPRARTPGNLPRVGASFVGRERELDELAVLLEGAGPLVTLTGSGGVGKTRLALQSARGLRGSFRDGTFFIPLAAAVTDADVASAIAEALEIDERAGEPLLETSARRLRESETLLVLDNFESVVSSAPLVSELIRRCPKLKVLTTSRERLHLRDEQELRLEPLAASDAEALFAERAAVSRPGVEFDSAQRQVVTEICRRLDGLPLAVELAAARARVLPLPAILERLEQRLSFLTGGARDLPERQRTLSATIEWSYLLLDDEERAMLLALAVFVGDASLEAAERVASSYARALEVLTSLCDKSLLVARTADDGSPRFTMLETIREYVLEQLRAEGREDESRRLHAAYLVELAERAEPELQGARQAVWLRRLAAEHENLRAALTWEAETGDEAMLLRLASALWRFWFVRGHLTEGRTWLTRAVSQRTGAEPATLARALFGASTLAAVAGDLEAARALAADRLEVCRSMGNDADVASALSSLANVTAAAGESGAAAELYEQAATHARRAGARPVLASVMSNLGYLSLLEEDPGAALATCREAAALFEELGVDVEAAGAWLNVASALLMLRRSGDAGPPLLRSLARYVDLQHTDGISYCLDAAAALAVEQQDMQTAGLLAGAAEAARARTEGFAPPVERRLRDEALAQIESSLGPEASAAARTEGFALTLEAAVAAAEAVARGMHVGGLPRSS
jgi:predicted ATPase/class 3 adenylate cyclase